MKFLLLLVMFAPLVPAQTPEVVELRRVAGGFEFTEGPAWWPAGHLLIFSDIPAGAIFGKKVGEEPGVYQKGLGGPNGNAFDEQARLYTCEGHERRVIRRDTKGKVDVIAGEFEGKRLNSPNDIVVRKDGHVYFTDPAFGTSDRQRELPFYGVYHVNTRKQLEVIAKPKGRPNGVDLSPDGKLLYVANSDERNIRAYDLDRRGSASGERVLVSGIDGVPDGMAVDALGNLYVAANGIQIFSSGGRFLKKIELEDAPSNCAFGGDDLSTLFVTARGSVWEIRLNVKGSLQY